MKRPLDASWECPSRTRLRAPDDTLRARVEHLIAAGDAASLRQGLSLLSAEGAGSRAGPDEHALDRERAWAVCRLLLASRTGEWEPVLGPAAFPAPESRHGFRPRSAGSIPPPPCSEERRLRLRFRWLSRMVHPDKCPLPRAAEAFQALASAMEWALKRASGDDVTEGPSGSPWPECSGDRRAGADGSPDAADAEEAADRAHLGLLSHEELCEVVRSRQQAVMAKLQNPAGICESLGKLQAALKSARTALSQKQHDTRSWEGCGFIPNL
uniref:J domain-containing protein n=1 Tax=Tetraselmis sp. GSL018 TaxID=582737 RepID=A0A061RB32_9CHLO